MALRSPSPPWQSPPPPPSQSPPPPSQSLSFDGAGSSSVQEELRMSSYETGEDPIEQDSIEQHGTSMDEGRKRVRCKYCGKEVNGFNRLKHHLGGVGSDVTSCDQVPASIMSEMRDSLIQKKKKRLLKEVGEINHPDLPLRRNYKPILSGNGCSPQKTTSATNLGKRKSDGGIEEEVADGTILSDVKSVELSLSTKGKNVLGLVKQEPVEEIYPNYPVTRETHPSIKKEEIKDDFALNATQCIGRFFYEAGVDLTAMRLPSFQRMMDAVISHGAGYTIPKYDELRGWVLQEELKGVRDRVESIKHTWKHTGCSILLDCWTDQKGRNLIAFLVHCPQGIVFLRSVDASSAIQNVESLLFLLGRVIEEVGVDNVVQVITNSMSHNMLDAGKKLEEKYKTIFWALCADKCVDLILSKLEELEHVKKVINEAKTITRFIYSHALPSELMGICMQGRDLVKSSKLHSVASFMTLENMVCERENLVHIFNSPAWHASSWACKTKGKNISNLVEEPAFWDAVSDVLKVSAPLIDVLHQIHKINGTPMGFLYETMDQAKELMKRNLEGDENRCFPYWSIVDDIWNNNLHSHLHSAGYYLNPCLFYSNDFFVDPEVTNGLVLCIVRLAVNQQEQNLIAKQLDPYKRSLGGFAEGVHDQRMILPPALWWSVHGGECPELQKLAFRILSQTCSGPAQYNLHKIISEQIHARGRGCVELQRLCDLEFIHNNLQLWRSGNKDGKDMLTLEDLSMVDDWVVEANTTMMPKGPSQSNAKRPPGFTCEAMVSRVIY